MIKSSEEKERMVYRRKQSGMVKSIMADWFKQCFSKEPIIERTRREDYDIHKVEGLDEYVKIPLTIIRYTIRFSEEVTQEQLEELDRRLRLVDTFPFWYWKIKRTIFLNDKNVPSNMSFIRIVMVEQKGSYIPPKGVHIRVDEVPLDVFMKFQDPSPRLF